MRKVWTDRSVKATTYRWTWSGKTAAGKYVKPGTYKITVTARSKFGAGAVLWPLGVRAQTPVKSIGFLGTTSAAAWGSWVGAFTQRLNQLNSGRRAQCRDRVPLGRGQLRSLH